MALEKDRTALFFMALMVAVLALGALVAAAAVDHARFSFDQVSLGPDNEILKFRFHGGSTRAVSTYSLMGDGRLLISISRNASDTPQLVSSGQLSGAELAAVIDSLIRSRLYAFDSEQVKARKRIEPNVVLTIKDAGAVEVEIHISLFPGTDPDGVDEIQRSFAVSGSDLAEGNYPSIEEFTALREIVAGLRRVEVRAVATDANP